MLLRYLKRRGGSFLFLLPPTSYNGYLFIQCEVSTITNNTLSTECTCCLNTLKRYLENHIFRHLIIVIIINIFILSKMQKEERTLFFFVYYRIRIVILFITVIEVYFHLIFFYYLLLLQLHLFYTRFIVDYYYTFYLLSYLVF